MFLLFSVFTIVLIIGFISLGARINGNDALPGWKYSVALQSAINQTQEEMNSVLGKMNNVRIQIQGALTRTKNLYAMLNSGHNDAGFAELSCANGLQKDYRGNKSTTITGETCLRWDSQSPHQHTRTPQNYPSSGLEENFCRNPDDAPEGAWCYVASSQRWEYCGIPQCDRRLGSDRNCPPGFAGIKPFCRSNTEAGLDESSCADGIQKDYRGTKSTTKTGIKCQRWDSQSPHQHDRTSGRYPHSGLVDNYCRNPDNEPGGAWCYTIDHSKRWDYCRIPPCGILERGAQCWNPCGDKGGKCKWCGSGSCCRRFWNDGAGCDGSNGCHNMHCCSDPSNTTIAGGISGYELIGDRYVKLYTVETSWVDANARCRAEGANLISITSNKTNEWLASQSQRSVWIGASDIGHEGEWTWPNGDEITHEFWRQDPKEPNNVGNGEDCAFIVAAREANTKDIGTWIDGDCMNHKTTFACERTRE